MKKSGTKAGAIFPQHIAGDSQQTRREKRAPRPFTVPHFKAWSAGLLLDTEEPWQLEPFQADFVRDLFAGRVENWLVVPEGNAKTTLAAGVVLYHALFRSNARAVVAASSRDQAEWLFDAAQGFVERSGLGPTKARVAHESREVEADRFRCFPGLREIRVNASKIKIFAADDRTGDGANFTLAILEELHRHRDLRLYRTWRGKAQKRGGQIFAISTAGEPEGEFEKVRARLKDEAEHVSRRGGRLRAVSKTTVIHDWSLPQGRDPDNMRDAKMANPLRAITPTLLQEKHDSPAMVPSHWHRFALGIPAALGSWLTPEEWDPLKVDIGALRNGEPVWLGIRVGQQGGCGIGIVATRPDETVAVGIEVHPYDLLGLGFSLRRLMGRYDVQEIYVDKRQHGLGIQTLESDLGFELTDVPQSPVKLMEATATFLGLVSSRKLVHDGDAELRKQVMAGRTKENTTGAYLEGSAETQALVALIVATHQAAEFAPPPLIVVPEVG